MSKSICSFCSKPFKPDQSGEANYMQVTKLEVVPFRWSQRSTYENLFMCFDCFRKLQENIAYNAENFRADIV
jgi:hypothetical protein